LVDGVDDHLIREFEQANTEVDRLSDQLLSMNKQQSTCLEGIIAAEIY